MHEPATPHIEPIAGERATAARTVSIGGAFG